LPEFLLRYPQVRVALHSSNRRVDVLNEGFDVALRVRSKPTGEDGLVMRTFRESRHLLVAAKTYLDQHGRPQRPEDVRHHETLSFEIESDGQAWDLQDRAGAAVRVEHSPRLMSHDFPVLRSGTLAGMGVALLPESVVRADLRSGSLEQVLPDW